MGLVVVALLAIVTATMMVVLAVLGVPILWAAAVLAVPVVVVTLGLMVQVESLAVVMVEVARAAGLLEGRVEIMEATVEPLEGVAAAAVVTAAAVLMGVRAVEGRFAYGPGDSEQHWTERPGCSEA
tara:strand:- start:703 stop:1080 length:378 start_codon:yes stop_codon:yes gene_type:complete